ncbi:MAG TPA: hypothetical protein IAC24_05920 [Candidatus Onthousia faecigallinarum]|nr:hypothetical protein [Candidatus Onthousia faecigallinarum]
MEQEEKKEEAVQIKRQSNKSFFFSIICLLIVLLMIVGFSTAIYSFTNEENNINTIDTGNISLMFTEDTNGITITDAKPLSDEMGKVLNGSGEYFDFTIQATIKGKATTTYEISAEKTTNSTLENNEVKLYLEQQKNGIYEEVMEPTVFTPLTEQTEIGSSVGSMLLTKNSVDETTSVKYRLRMWMADDAEITGTSRTFSVQVAVNAKIDT